MLESPTHTKGIKPLRSHNHHHYQHSHTYHDMLGGEVQVGHQPLKGVDEGHSLGNVQGKLEHLGSLNDNATLLVQHVEEGTERKVLCDHHQVWGTVAAPHNWQHVRVGEYPGKGERMKEN